MRGWLAANPKTPPRTNRLSPVIMDYISKHSTNVKSCTSFSVQTATGYVKNKVNCSSYSTNAG